jgi:hypothetical protein
VPPSCSVRTHSAYNAESNKPYKLRTFNPHPIGLRIDLSVRLTLPSMARRPRANTPITLQATVAFALTALPGSDQVSGSPHGTYNIPYPLIATVRNAHSYSDTSCAKSLAGYGHWSLCADISSRKSLWPSTLDGHPRVLSF